MHVRRAAAHLARIEVLHNDLCQVPARAHARAVVAGSS